MDTVQLNYKELGDSGKPIFILHGLFGMLDNWMTFGRALSQEYHVFLVDQRNHGDSPRATPHSYDAMASDLVRLMNSLAVDKASIIGHSMGGKTGLRCAQLFPDRVSSCISVDMGIKAYKESHKKYIDAMNKVNVSALTRRSDAEKILRSLIKNEGIRLFLLKNLRRKSDGTYDWKFNLSLIEKEYATLLQALPSDPHYLKPILFVSGGNSTYILPSDVRRIKSIFPKAIFEVIPEAGHWVHVDQHEKLLQISKNFLTQ